MTNTSKQNNITDARETFTESRLWRCENCGDKGELVAWSYGDLAKRGEPVCLSCGADMILIDVSKSG